MKNLILFLAVLVSCTTAPKQLKEASLTRKVVIPEGTYNHDVALFIKDGNRDLSLKGIVEIGRLRIQVVGLSMFGTTEFRLDEDRTTGSLSVEIYRDSMKPAETKIRGYYQILRQFLTAEKQDTRFEVTKTNNHGFPEEMKSKDARFYLRDYDQNQIPLNVKIEHPDFHVQIKVTDYEI
jgi:hypothetical protein